MTVLVAFAWQDDAACKHVDLRLFFGPEGESDDARARRERRVAPICAGCPVRAQCFAHSVGRPEHFGYWAGLGEAERRAVRRRDQREARYERENELRRARRRAAKQVAS